MGHAQRECNAPAWKTANPSLSAICPAGEVDAKTGQSSFDTKWLGEPFPWHWGLPAPKKSDPQPAPGHMELTRAQL